MFAAQLLLSLHNAWLWAKLYARLYAGRFTEARSCAKALQPRWRHVLGVSRDSAIYCEALTLHLQGDFEAAAKAIAPVRPRYRTLLEGASLLMEGDQLERAHTLLVEACKTHRMPEDLMFLALAQKLTDRESAATFEEASKGRPAGRMARLNEPIFHYLRGIYLLKTGGDALADLKAAAGGSPPSVYVTRARALLPRPPQDDDPRSTLAPQILDE